MNTPEEIDQCVVARYNIFHGLRTGRHRTAQKWIRIETHPEKNTNTGKDRFSG